MTKRMTVIRNGRVLDIKGHRAPQADILIEGRHDRGDRAARPAGARRTPRSIDAKRQAAPSRPDQRPHPRPRQSRQGHGRSLDARAAADGRALDQRQPHARGQVPVEPASARPRW